MLRPLGALALAALLLVPTAALGSHMQSYTRLPEHDDLGRSDEPDRATTSVLGPFLAQRVIDPTNTDNAMALPDSSFPLAPSLAPGCSDDAGRQPSGLCYLNLVVRFLGVTGMTGNNAPGLTRTKDAAVRFLDARQDQMASFGAVRVFDVNHKLSDSPLAGTLAQNGVSPFVVGPTELWAWFGVWQDRNGNGVIDHEQDGEDPGTVSARNEFVWVGGCLDLAHRPRAPTPVCKPVADARLAGFIVPGNHHGSCGGGTVAGLDPVVGCSSTPADVPGLQVYCLAQEGLAEQFPQGVSGLLFDVVNVHGCGNQPEALEQDSEQYGDPLLDNPRIVRPDFYYDDRSGEPDIEARQWIAGQGYPAYFYDSSILGTTVFIAAEGAPFSSAPQTIDLAKARFLDIDIDRAWNPLADTFLQATLKPVVQSVWLSNRESVVAAFNTGSVVGRGALLDPTPVTGPVQAQLLDPGYAHEPNDPRDVSPALYQASGPRTHEGFTNDYAAYQAQPRGWLDAQSVRVMTENLGWQLPEPSGDVLSQCLICTGGPGLTSSLTFLAGPRGPGQDPRALDPGLWNWAGRVGLWWDRPQHRIEESIDLDPQHLRFNVSHFLDPPDGWVGNVVNATGAYVYRGYQNATCAVHGPPAEHPYAWCHPTRDGSLEDPQDYSAGSLEWRGQCVSTQNVNNVVLVPEGNVWSMPAIVLHDLDTSPPTGANAVEVWTGRADDPRTPENEAALPLHIRCDDVLLGTFHTSDYLFLPEGNLGVAVLATTAAKVQRLDGQSDTMQDVDAYVATAPPV